MRRICGHPATSWGPVLVSIEGASFVEEIPGDHFSSHSSARVTLMGNGDEVVKFVKSPFSLKLAAEILI